MFGRKVINVKDQMIHVKSKQNNQKLREVFLMSKARKLLAVAVVCAMVFGMMIPAFALGSDVVGTEYESAAAKLGALEIMVGDAETGNFRPNDTIKRSEFAKVGVIALGLEAAAKAANGATQFADVVSNHWATGYINIASAQGLILGDGDGNFRPDDEITYAEALTILVRVLGYGPVMDNGMWPINYITKSAEIGLTDDISVNASENAIRGVVAQLTENALDIPMLIQVGYGSETKYVKSGTEDTDEETIVDNKLDVDVMKAKVTSVEDNEIEVRKEKNDEYTEKETYDVLAGISLVGLEDAIVTLWVKDDTVLNIEIESDVLYDYVKKIADDESDVKLKNADNTYDVAEGLDISSLAVDQFAKFVIEDSEIITVEAYDLTKAGIITDVQDDYVEYTKGSNEDRKLRGLEDADSLLVVIDGEAAEYSALKEDMVFDYNKNDKDFVLVASSTKAEGEFTKLKSDKMTVGDDEYDLDSPLYYSTDNGAEYTTTDKADDLLGEEIVAYADAAGNIRYVKGDVEESASDFYGVVVNAWATDNEYVKIFKNANGSGEEITYALDLNDSEVTFADIDGVTENTENAFYKFTLDKDGDITSIANIDFAEDKADDNAVFQTVSEFDADDDTILVNKDTEHEDTFYVEDAEFFNLYNDKGDFEPALVDWADIESKGTLTGLEMKVDNDKQTELVVFVNGFENISSDDELIAFVDDKYKVSKDNYKLYLETADDSIAVEVDADDLNGAVEDAFVVYTDEGNNMVKVSSTLTLDSGMTVADNVYDIDDDFIQMSEEGSWIKIADDVIVYEVNADHDKFTKVDVADIDTVATNGTGDKVWYYVADEMVNAIFFERQ